MKTDDNEHRFEFIVNAHYLENIFKNKRIVYFKLIQNPLFLVSKTKKKDFKSHFI